MTLEAVRTRPTPGAAGRWQRPTTRRSRSGDHGADRGPPLSGPRGRRDRSRGGGDGAFTSATSSSPRSLYFATGHGMTVGFHRLLAHKSFTARRPLKLILVALGSMAYEGGPIGWVANHRRHHVVRRHDRATPTRPHQPGPGACGDS